MKRALMILAALVAAAAGGCKPAIDSAEAEPLLGGVETVVASSTTAPTTSPTQPAHVNVPTTGLRAITLPVIDSPLPPGPGRLTVMSACTQCHTPRYITMQPAFSRKKWTEEVEKMKKVYGAPVQDEQVPPVVNYLIAIRGNGQ